jgi:hypothetical protein
MEQAALNELQDRAVAERDFVAEQKALGKEDDEEIFWEDIEEEREDLSGIDGNDECTDSGRCPLRRLCQELVLAKFADLSVAPVQTAGLTEEAIQVEKGLRIQEVGKFITNYRSE